LQTAALLPPAWRSKLAAADTLYARLDAMFAQATGGGGGGTAMQKLRIVRLRFGTARQKVVLE
jgi:hypothetical protein